MIFGVRSNDDRVHCTNHFLRHQRGIKKGSHSSKIKFSLRAINRSLYFITDGYDLVALFLHDSRMYFANATNAKHAVFINFADHQ